MARKLTEHEQDLFAEALVNAAPSQQLLDSDTCVRLVKENLHRAPGVRPIDWEQFSRLMSQEDSPS
jgi:hypothetical protein